MFQVWVVYWRYRIDVPVSETELRWQQVNSASYEYRKMSARRGVQFVPIWMPTVCWKTFPTKTTNVVSIRNSSILMMSSSEYLLLELVCFFGIT